ncbi:TRAP transporter small permease [Acidovorax sp. JMULE5]|uniref:TRAP transporter small permease n=1 Tax=Acidovorax sp. JMULE5 TaxID=2518343 RepID=UPI0015A0637E|nr:TRAP transporter small permease [Acidovorax sp. JMULE5]QLA83417.1 TRAP transporter small permease [Acidovorax sp. JMULE5]
MLNALIDRCCRWINVLIALALAVMVVMVFGNVVLRYAFNSGIAVSEEVSRWLFVWITFLGAIVAVKEHGHLGTDLVLTKLPPIAQRVCLVISHGLMLFCTWLLFSGALSQARINWDVEAPVTGASVAIFYASGVVFAVASGLLLLLNLWRLLSGQVPDDQLVQTSGSEDVANLPDMQLDRAAFPSRKPPSH